MSIQAGEKINLPCNVNHDERNKITSIEWTKDDKSIQGLDNVDFGYDGSLTIFNVQTRHQGSYRCKVKTMKDSASAEVPLNVIVNGPVITKYSDHKKIFSGTSVNLECVATGIPTPEISWSFNKTSTSVTGETYEVKNAITADSGHYTCTAENSVGQTKKTLEVSVVTVPVLKEEYKIKKGSKLTIPCVQSGQGLQSTWHYNNAAFQQSDEAFVDNEGNLMILNMTEAMEGDYSCKINIMKDNKSKEERIISTKVIIMADIVLTKSDTISIDEGGNFTLKCDVLPGVNAKRMWYQNGEIVHPSPEAGVDIIDYSSTLVVSQAQVGNSGN